MDHIFDIDNLSENKCFLCGDSFTHDNRSDEHVIPAWLQHKCDLWNQKLVLLNRTSIPYRNLTIPCCKDCNTGCLSQMENDVGAAFNAGYEAVKSLPECRLFEWCSKVWYGLIFREYSLSADRSKPDSGNIIEKEALEAIKTHHSFMQSIRVPYRFMGFKPASIFIARCHTYDDPRGNFDYADLFFFKEGENYTFAPFFAVRIGETGVFCAFGDLGLQNTQTSLGELGVVNGQILHPIHFLEVAAKIAYRHTLFGPNPLYMTVGPGESGEYVTAVTSSGHGWAKGNEDQYKAVLYGYLRRCFPDGVPDWVTNCPEGQSPTMFRKPDGSPLIVDRDFNEIHQSDADS